MMLPAGLHPWAALAFARLLYSLIAGTALVVVVSAALRLLPPKNSQTRFALWFSAMIAVAALPFSALDPSWLGSRLHSAHAWFTMPAAWAEYIVLAWAVFAALGLLRMMVGLWQLRRLRRSASSLPSSGMDPEIGSLVDRWGGRRPVSLLVSSRVEVPTAIGFLRPAIILPAWMVLDNASAREHLKYILLHELAHLRRWDDWTNLAQQLVKSVLFFHPGILWIERELALDREMACDDAVLHQTGSPRSYAECLAEVAEKSLLRRQIALAQAAVSRMKQLSHRVARILKHDGSQNTRVWKPAIPLVAGVAVLCAVSAAPTTELIGFNDTMPLQAAAKTAPPLKSVDAVAQPAADSAAPAMPTVIPAGMKNSSRMRAIPADLRYSSPQPHRRISRLAKARRSAPNSLMQRAAAPEQTQRSLSTDQVRMVLSSYALTPVPLTQDEEKAGVANAVLVVFTTRQVSNRDSSWHVSEWQLYLYVPPPTKQVPRKT